MVDETITTARAGEPAPATHTTVIHERGSSSGGMGIFMAVILLIAVVGGIYLFSQNSASESAKDNAIANAATSVGDAANKVGNAAENAVDPQ